MQLIDSERLDTLRQLADDDPTFLVCVIDAFLPQLVSTPADLRQAHDRGDIETVIRLAHSLKGSSSNLGAEAVRQLCMKIEQSARAGSLEGMSGWIDELAEVSQATSRHLAEEKGV